MGLYLLSLLKGVPDSALQNVTDTFLLFIEESVCNYEFVAIQNSTIAIAAILNAGENIVIVGLDSKSRLFFQALITKSIGEKLNPQEIACGVCVHSGLSRLRARG